MSKTLLVKHELQSRGQVLNLGSQFFESGLLPRIPALIDITILGLHKQITERRLQIVASSGRVAIVIVEAFCSVRSHARIPGAAGEVDILEDGNIDKIPWIGVLIGIPDV